MTFCVLGVQDEPGRRGFGRLGAPNFIRGSGHTHFGPERQFDTTVSQTFKGFYIRFKLINCLDLLPHEFQHSMLGIRLLQVRTNLNRMDGGRIMLLTAEWRSADEYDVEALSKHEIDESASPEAMKGKVS